MTDLPFHPTNSHAKQPLPLLHFTRLHSDDYFSLPPAHIFGGATHITAYASTIRPTKIKTVRQTREAGPSTRGRPIYSISRMSVPKDMW